jgi:hypothetical protein
MFRNWTDSDLLWAWRVMLLACSIVTACSTAFLASSAFVAMWRVYWAGS